MLYGTPPCGYMTSPWQFPADQRMHEVLTQDFQRKRPQSVSRQNIDDEGKTRPWVPNEKAVSVQPYFVGKAFFDKGLAVPSQEMFGSKRKIT